MPGPQRINRDKLVAVFPATTVDAIFADGGGMQPSPRLATACLVASRIAEGILRKAWPSDAQLDVLFAEDDAIVALTCQLAIAQGVSGRSEWSGEGSPYAGLEKSARQALQDIVAGEMRSRGESQGAGTNPTILGSITPTTCPPFMFAPQRGKRRGGY